MSSPASITVSNEAKQKHCPAPLASHEDVVKDPALFGDTLTNFHSVLGGKYMIPVIGGKDLNLHVLYVEVTKRGGYDKVILEKKWREVSSVFDFSPTRRSASYALGKHYFSLLHHYEQVYFFKLQGPLLSSTAVKFSCGPKMVHLTEYSSERIRDRRKSIDGGPICFLAIGTIEGKFDCGYLVSVNLGSEILNGVLYHPEQPSSSMFTAQSCTAIILYNPKPHRRHRRKRGRDPSHPKPNRSGYNFFFAEKHSVLKISLPK